MFEMISEMFCFVTAAVSFLYGTRMCWVCGKKCNFGVAPAEKKQCLKATILGSFVVYFFGFLVVLKEDLSGTVTIVITSLISALLLSHFVISMAMPELKRNPSIYID